MNNTHFWPSLHGMLALAFSIVASPVVYLATSIARAFTEPLIYDARTSLDLDRAAHESHAVEPAERSRFLSYLDRARSHDLFAGDGFAYG